jgi:hypothetical protein
VPVQDPRAAAATSEIRGLLRDSYLVLRLGDEDLLEGLELLDALARPDRHRVQRVVGDVY